MGRDACKSVSFWVQMVVRAFSKWAHVIVYKPELSILGVIQTVIQQAIQSIPTSDPKSPTETQTSDQICVEQVTQRDPVSDQQAWSHS